MNGQSLQTKVSDHLLHEYVRRTLAAAQLRAFFGLSASFLYMLSLVGLFVLNRTLFLSVEPFH